MDRLLLLDHEPALRLTVAASAVGAAAAGFGLLHLVDWPTRVEFACAFVLLDLVVHFQHALLHAVPGLWRLHMMHRTDLNFDVTPIVALIGIGVG